MRCAPQFALCLALILGPGGFQSGAQTPQTPPAQPQTPPAAQPQPPPKPRPRQPAPAAKLTLTVMVTALDGKTLPDVLVNASGPADREGRTDPSGLISFANLPPGTYRLRFEHDEFVTLEKEVSLTAGRSPRISATLTAAPPPPPPPQPDPVPQPQPSAPPDGNYSPSSVSIPDFIEKNYVGGAPIKRSPLGCGGSSTSTLVQTKEPIAEHTHDDADEIIYVVAGEGTHNVAGRESTLAAGSFAAVPRGTAHSLTRRGSRPLIFVATLAGPPCQAGK
jgi:Cupin domain/Carboxypeptidase regulatory-like domain